LSQPTQNKTVFTALTIFNTLTVPPVTAAAAASVAIYGDLHVTLLGVAWYSHVLNLLVILIGLFLMLIILIQRGKGGGLAGAFGGAGGSSPFGSKAADQFVKITLWLAAIWVLVIMIHVKIVKSDAGSQAEQSVIGQS
jgi:preprotein translocase subunit SecG